MNSADGKKRSFLTVRWNDGLAIELFKPAIIENAVATSRNAGEEPKCSAPQEQEQAYRRANRIDVADVVYRGDPNWDDVTEREASVARNKKCPSSNNDE